MRIADTLQFKSTFRSSYPVPGLFTLSFHQVTAIVALLIMLTLSLESYAQRSNAWVRQIVTANSGKFEFSPPYTDFVTLQTYNPATAQVSDFSAIFTQSAQEIVISDNIAFVGAQDSIVKFRLDNAQRLGSVANSGISKMILYKQFLIVSKQYPVTDNFVDILDTTDLSLVATVAGISGDCGGLAFTGDSIYVAVNGGWMGTTGKIAVIDPASWSLKREIGLGAEAIGINNLYQYQGRIISINKTPYGMPPVGSITRYDPFDGTFVNRVVGLKIGNDASNKDAAPGISDSLLYVIFNEGVGSFNLNTMQIADTTVVPDPGSAMFRYILSSVIDTVNNQLHLNIGDYVTPGFCLVTSLTGDSVTSYATGISSDAAAIDYRFYPLSAGYGPFTENQKLILWPNPVSEILNIEISGKTEVNDLRIIDIAGKTVLKPTINPNAEVSFSVPVNSLKPGFYTVVVKSESGILVKKFIKANL